ncbi:MAG: 1-acyl-sn-glycerol-3-phosphate acyltransferase [Lachnospiraceae bacterium]|nr:1-acyl-sn-glycerol-3-phosphate acyltransferase [Lachnospiraceae bacterium]
MKIKTKKLSYDEVCKLPYKEHRKPIRPNKAVTKLARALSSSELKKVNFTYEMIDMDKLSDKEPCLILMNHSSFIDLEIVNYIFKNRPFNIVCTSDGFVGKDTLMRSIGCIPTQKFVTDLTLVKDMLYCVSELKTSVLMYPEASYSFDGTKTPLPGSLAKCIKLLNVPVVFIETFGAFARDPLYNGLRLRNVDVSAKVTYLMSKEKIRKMSATEISALLDECFSFDYFKWQKDNKIKVSEDFRTLGLERVLYKCPACKKEGTTKGTGIKLVCNNCNKTYTMNEYGEMLSDDGNTEFSHIPDWYKWERECVREELLNNTYSLDIPVEIKILKDTNAIYEVGEGRLIHDKSGFTLTGCDGKLSYKQSPKLSYSLYADYFWYEIGDVICIGDNKTLYYCFPKDSGDVVAKTRLATEELYNMSNSKEEML